MTIEEYLRDSSKPNSEVSRRRSAPAALAKCEEYHAWGVPYCWVLDPVKQTAWEYHAQSDPSKVEGEGTLHAGNLILQLADLFATHQPTL